MEGELLTIWMLITCQQVQRRALSFIYLIMWLLKTS